MHGAKHAYVGMNIFFLGNGEVKISMINYLKECIIALDEDCTGIDGTPAGSHGDPNCAPLIKSKRKTLHSIVVKLLFFSMSARPDIQVLIA